MKTYLNRFFKRNSIQRILIVYFLIFILMIVGLLYAVSARFMSTTMINNYFSEYLDSIYSDFEKTLNKKFVQINVTATDITIWNELYKIIVDEDKLRYGKFIITADADVSKTAYERLFA